VNYSIQLAAPKAPKLQLTARRRAEAWGILLGEFMVAHPHRWPSSITVLEVSAWKAARK
jgi:hypothetical protein